MLAAADPGAALARLARRIAVGTARAAAALPGAVVTGNPVRSAFFEIPSLVSRSKERRLRVLVVGGSQGAEILNRLVPDALARVAARGISFDVVHQAGKGRAGEVVTAYGKRGLSGDRAFVHEFLDDMAAAYAAADLIVARAGAMTVAEVAAAGRPALLVPFAAATHGHQEANGRVLESEGAAVVVTEAEATEESLAAALAGLLGDPRVRQAVEAVADALMARKSGHLWGATAVTILTRLRILTELPCTRCVGGKTVTLPATGQVCDCPTCHGRGRLPGLRETTEAAPDGIPVHAIEQAREAA